MLNDKQMKKAFKKVTEKEPEKHYPIETLKAMGYARKPCIKCGTFFWSMDPDRQVCGDSQCEGGLSFVGKSPAKEPIDYLDVWPRFSRFFKDKSYKEVERKPVVARWRDDAYWVAASVYGFQPYVVRGETKPPAKAVVIPQLSLRFNDIDNVGITGSHYVCFDMLGQLHFEKKEDYKPSVYFQEYYEWINKGMGIPKEEIVLHEDAWAGGGTYGPSIEFFSRGMEIGNQVYMQYANTESGGKELDIKVLDMGQGHERVPWFTHGNSTSYETTFPTVNRHLYDKTGFKPNKEIMQKFLPYSTLLNADEADDIEQVWRMISDRTRVDIRELKENVQTMGAIYSIAEHSRAALVALNDGALPSNVGGGYNIRVVIRRALGLIEKHGWSQIDFPGLIAKHADFLKPLYPELSENVENIQTILHAEMKKFAESRKRAKQVIENTIRKGDITTDTLVELYDSHGIDPEQVRKEAAAKDKAVKVPDDFFALVAERHENQELVLKTKKRLPFQTEGLPATEILYYNDYKLTEFDGKVVSVQGRMVALDRTAFYPTSGGQIHDIGTLWDVKVVDVVKQDGIVIHVLETEPVFKTEETVHGSIARDRRIQVAQHHTGAHILNAAARKVLGHHVFQAGAAKTPEKARLDITHYDLLGKEELDKIEAAANDIIKADLPVRKMMIPREEAEEKYGVRIYQGGFVPGKKLRIVSIGDIDVEACGGTHLDHTGEADLFRIIGSSKVQDGVIRINYVCGKRAHEFEDSVKATLERVAKFLGTDDYFLIPARAEELFTLWKKAKKGKAERFTLQSTERYDGNDIIEKTCEILNTQAAHLERTIEKFTKQLAEFGKKEFDQGMKDLSKRE